MPIKELNLELEPKLNRLDVYSRREILARTMEGEWSALFKGRGIEFAGFRTYQYGDDASTIDWKASLKSKETLIREFEEYKNFTVFFLLDVSNKMVFGSGSKLKCEFAAEIVYMMCDAINKVGDSIGLAMFNDNFVTTVSPQIGPGVLQNIKNSLSDPKNYGGEYDLKRALTLSKSMLSGRAVLIIISDFIGLKPGWEKYIQYLSDQFELIAIMVKDRRDVEFPDTGGQFLLQDPFSKQNIYIDTKKYSKIYREMVRKEEEWIEAVFRKSRGDFVKLITDDPAYLERLVKFFQNRSKKSE